MYVEASTRGEGQTAHLVSPKYQGMGEQCVEFYYHMWGRDVGTLHVYTQVSKIQGVWSFTTTCGAGMSVPYMYIHR